MELTGKNKIEVFKNIPNYPNYKVSNLGRVKSIKRTKWNGYINQEIPERILREGVSKTGYCNVVLHNKDGGKSFNVHQLVAIVWLKHKPNGFNGLVVDHINNNKTDNRVENLQLVSNRINNSKDRFGSSEYTGVSWCKTKKKWKSGIYINGKSKHLGYFTNELEAASKYKEAFKKADEIRNEQLN